MITESQRKKSRGDAVIAQDEGRVNGKIVVRM
jgi:hypothetical protein